MKYTNQTAVSIIFSYTQFSNKETADKKKNELRKDYVEWKNETKNVCRKGSKATQTEANEH